MNDLNKVSALWMFGGTAIFMLNEFHFIFSYIGLVICFLALIGFLIPDKLYNKMRGKTNDTV